jgi:uncharacterized protein YxeA
MIMKKILALVALAFMVGAPIFAQDVKREGNTFVQVQSDKVSLKNDTKTQYTYKAKDGKEYPIYLSKNGKAFIVRVSKKSGKEYKQYLPQVTEQLSKEDKK